MGSKLKKFISNLGQTWAMATDPVVMQASGYKSTPEGVRHEDSDSAKQLRENIAFISTAPNIVMNAGMAGIIPTVVSEIGAAVGGVGGNYVGQKFDENMGTTYWTPIGGFVGALLGGGLGYKTGYKGGKYMIKHDMLPENAVGKRIVTEEMVKDASSDMFRTQVAKTAVENQGLPHNVGWAPAERKSWWHHSNEPVSKFKVPFKERWDVVNHDADPNLIWLTKEDGSAGMMAERPYHTQFEVNLKKPMVQVGEVKTVPRSKNSSRNAIVKHSRDMGADAVIFDGIADNKLKGQQVVAVMGDKVTPTKVYSTQRRVEVKSPKNKQGSIKILDDGNEVGFASYKIEDGYVIPTSITKIDNQSPYISVEAYDGMVKLAKSMGLSGVRSGDYLVSPEVTRKILTRYDEQGALKHLDFLGMDVLNGPGQPRVVITEELLTPTRIKIKQRGGQIKPNFIQRLEDPSRKSIPDWESYSRTNPYITGEHIEDHFVNMKYPVISTHKMAYDETPDDSGRAIVYPMVQGVNGKLVDYTRPPYHSWAGYDSALDRGDYLTMKDLEEARKWVKTYKDRYKNLK